MKIFNCLDLSLRIIFILIHLNKYNIPFINKYNLFYLNKNNFIMNLIQFIFQNEKVFQNEYDTA